MKSAIWSKIQTQNTIKTLRAAGYVVDKINAGYQATHDGQLVFKAMAGHRNYLVRYDQRLFEVTA